MKARRLLEAQVRVPEPDLHHEPGDLLQRPRVGDAGGFGGAAGWVGRLVDEVKGRELERRGRAGKQLTQGPQREEQARKADGSDADEE